MTIAFGRYIAVQNGEASQLTDAAATILRAQLESSNKSPELLQLIFCELQVDCNGSSIFVSTKSMKFHLFCVYVSQFSLDRTSIGMDTS